MIDGISVAFPTYNHLNYLKKCIYSIKKYSVLPKTELSLFVDGATDGTFEWLEEEGIPHIGRRENKGAFSGWNRAAKNCQNEYCFLAEDDLFFGPKWDYYLAVWIEELEEDYVIMPQLVEPTPGNYPPPYDCGRSIEEFDEEKFVEYCERIRKHEVIADPFGLVCMRKELIFSIGGFDENFDPILHGGLDFTYRFSKAHPEINWIRVCDSLIYHFPPRIHRRQSLPHKWEHYEKMDEEHGQYFKKKHGFWSVPQTYGQVPVGLKSQ